MIFFQVIVFSAIKNTMTENVSDEFSLKTYFERMIFWNDFPNISKRSCTYLRTFWPLKEVHETLTASATGGAGFGHLCRYLSSM